MKRLIAIALLALGACSPSLYTQDMVAAVNQSTDCFYIDRVVQHQKDTSIEAFQGDFDYFYRAAQERKAELGCD